MNYTNVEIAFLLLLLGAVVSFFTRNWRTAGWLATGFVGLSTILAWRDGWRVLMGGETLRGPALSLLSLGSELAVSLDPLGAGFLLLITAVSLVATAYSIEYMRQYHQEHPGRFYSLLQLFIAGMVGVVCVSDWLFFLIFWEWMTLASYFLVTFERENPEAIRAGFKYFIMTHVATAGLLVAAVVLWSATGSFAFESHRIGLASSSGVLKHLILALYLLAFSTKAGIFPVGDWLPDAHPAAPSGVSAILSGVMIKLGAYGVLRVFWGILPNIGTRKEIIVWGIIIASLGALSAFVGGLTAMKENDSKRLLAFSSISQTGYIFLSLGIGITFAASSDFFALALLGLLGAGFHILNDAIFKSLLFMSAGSILYSTGTRDLNRVGGLSSVMPIAAAAALVGVFSLSGLPPTNGFASKWVIYQASIAGGQQFAPFILVALVAFFVSLSTFAYSFKFYTVAFLGNRAASQTEPRPLPLMMSLAQLVLAFACIAIGLAPSWAIRLISSMLGVPLSQIFQTNSVGGLAAVSTKGLMPSSWSPIALSAIFLACFLIAEIIRRSGHARTRMVPAWYCGEEHSDDEVRSRAHGFYLPFNEAFAKVYPRWIAFRPPRLKGVQFLLDFDAWLYHPLVREGGKLVDRVSRSHVGIPQLYIMWQVAGMIVVLVLLFLMVR